MRERQTAGRLSSSRRAKRRLDRIPNINKRSLCLFQANKKTLRIF